MTLPLTNFKPSTSIWQSLRQLDHLLSQPLSWAKRLEEICSILLEALDVEAIWLLTVEPLPATATGLGNTPLAMAPNARVHMVDKAPPLTETWPSPASLIGQVIASRQPYFVQPGNNLNGSEQADCDLGDVFFSAVNVTPCAIIPLIAADQLLGVLAVARAGLAPAVLPADLQGQLVHLGEHMAENLYNAYRVDQARRHTGILQTLNQIAQTITSSLSIDDVIQRTMAGINKIMDVEAGSLLMLDEETGELYFRLTLRGEYKQITSFRLQKNEGIAGWVVNSGQPAIVNNAGSDPRFSPKIDRATGFITRQILCVPLLVQGKVIGVLEMLNKYDGFFDDNDQELLVSMAASLSIALHNASLYKAAEERAQRSEIINQVITAISAGHSLSDTAKFIFEQLGRLLSFDHLSVSLLDDTRETLHLFIFSEYGCIEQKKLMTPLKNSALATLMAQDQLFILDDIKELSPDQPVYPEDTMLRQEHICTRIIFSLATDKNPFGSLNIGSRRKNAYQRRDLVLLEQLVPQLATAIEKAYLLDRTAQRTNQLQMLNHLGEMLASTTDLGRIVDTALSMIPRLLPGDIQGIIIAGEQGAYVGIAVPFGFNMTEQVIKEMLHTFAELSEGQELPQVISSRSIAGNMPVAADWQPITVLTLPILTRLGALGVLYMASGKEENLSNDLLRIFSLIVSQISAAVENARLFQQVEQERARLVAILTSSTDGVLVVDRNGRIVLDNPAAWKLMGVEESQSGQLLAKVTQNNALVELFNSAMAGGKRTGELRPFYEDRTFFANLSPVTVGNMEEIIGWVGTMQDVSHFKELDQLKSDFVHTVSHDLRSPLAGVLLATKLMGTIGPVTGEQLGLLETIEKRVGAMSQLIDDLLDVGKIDAGIDMEMEPSRLAPIVDETIRFFSPQAQTKSIELHGHVAPSLPLVMANPLRLRQVLHNLVGNGIKYTPSGGSVSVRVFKNDNHEVQIEVADSGFGIPASDQPRIFEKFYRVRGPHVAQIKGTGLGLAITKGIVEKHSGRIWLQSVFGEGSTFIVALPAGDDQE